MAPDNVNFIDPVPHSQVQNLVAQYKLVLGKQNNSIGVSELESMQMGIPTLFPFNYNEFYDQPIPMEPTNPETITRIMESDECVLGARQREWVSKYHDLRKVTKRLIDYYNKLLE